MRFISIILAAVCWITVSLAADGSTKPIYVGYYQAWKEKAMEGVDYSKYTHVNIAFALPDPSGNIEFEKESTLPSLVKNLQSNDAKVLLSVGGWTGSNNFSSILKTPTARSTLMNKMVSYVKDNNLDGIDIDWEYPGYGGTPCNIPDSANDTPNFLKYLKDLREEFNTKFGEGKKLITLAVYIKPFYVNDAYSKQVAEFAKYVDWANIMTYDINGAWGATSGPNAPFKNEPGKGAANSFVSAIEAWTAAGWPANQLTAGFAFYGRSTTLTVEGTSVPANEYQPQSKVPPKGDKEDAKEPDKICLTPATYSGQWQWKHLRDQNVLSKPETAADPWKRQWDDVSKTPWLYNPKTKIFISYDDPKSIKVKVDYAAKQGLRGAMIWAMDKDYNNELLDALHTWDGSPSSGDGSDSSGDGNDPPDDIDNPPADKKNTKNGACTTDGEYKCAKSDGTDPGYSICASSKWVTLACGEGSACYSNGKSIYCGVPNQENFFNPS